MLLDIQVNLELREDFYNFFSNKDYLKQAIIKIFDDTIKERLKQEINDMTIKAGDFYENISST